ncbi:MAG: energy-coupling factor transporter transmembrane component T family protein [Candidatus Aquicultorales bacterium]
MTAGPWGLDPRTKLLLLVVYSVFVLSLDSPHALSTALALLLVSVVYAGLSPIDPVRALKPALPLLAVFFFFDLLLGGESGSAAVVHAIVLVGRLGLLLVASAVLTLTTPSYELAYALETLLKPLKRVGVPVHQLALATMLAVGFLPTLADQAERIRKAQSARGVDFDSGGLLLRVKRLSGIAVPLLVLTMRRADELATAMEVRGYKGEGGRTRMMELRMRTIDWVVLSGGAIVIIGMIVLSRLL